MLAGKFLKARHWVAKLRPGPPVAERLPEGSHAASAHGTRANVPQQGGARSVVENFVFPLPPRFRFPAFPLSAFGRPIRPAPRASRLPYTSGSQCHDADCTGGPGGDVAASDRGMGQPVQQLPVWVLAHAGD